MWCMTLHLFRNYCSGNDSHYSLPLILGVLVNELHIKQLHFTMITLCKITRGMKTGKHQRFPLTEKNTEVKFIRKVPLCWELVGVLIKLLQRLEFHNITIINYRQRMKFRKSWEAATLSPLYVPDPHSVVPVAAASPVKFKPNCRFLSQNQIRTSQRAFIPSSYFGTTSQK